MRDRLAHADIVQRLARHVEEQRPGAAGPAVVEDRIGLLLLQAREPSGHRGALDHVDVALDEGQRARRGLGQEQLLQPVDLRLAAPVLVERAPDDLLLRLVADELERAGAHRVEPHLVAELLDRLAALHVAAEARHAAERVDERARLRQMHHHGVGIRRLHALDLAEVGGILRSGLRIRHPLDGERHVVRGELAEPLVPLHAMPQMEGPGARVGRHLPAFRELALQLVRLDLRRAVRRADQCVVDLPDGELVAVADAVAGSIAPRSRCRDADPGDRFQPKPHACRAKGSWQAGWSIDGTDVLSPCRRSRAGLHERRYAGREPNVNLPWPPPKADPLESGSTFSPAGRAPGTSP